MKQLDVKRKDINMKFRKQIQSIHKDKNLNLTEYIKILFHLRDEQNTV